MDDRPDKSEAPEANRNLQWIGASVFLLGLGSMGPLNVYYAFTDQRYLDKLSGWRILILPFGAWLLTGFLVMGVTAFWLGGIRGNPAWPKHMDQAWNWWCKLGWWLLGLAVALVLAAFLFSGVASFLATLDKGTVLIAILLLMILLALWRIGDQMKRR